MVPVAAQEASVICGTVTSGTIERTPPAVIETDPLDVTPPTTRVPDRVTLAEIVAPEPVAVKVAPAATLTLPVAGVPTIDGTVKFLQTFKTCAFPDAVGSHGPMAVVTVPVTQGPATQIVPPPVDALTFTSPLPVKERVEPVGTDVVPTTTVEVAVEVDCTLITPLLDAGTTTLVAVTEAPPVTTAPPSAETAKVLAVRAAVVPVTTTGAAVASTVEAAAWVETVVIPVIVPLAGRVVETDVDGTFGKLAVPRAVAVVESTVTVRHWQLLSVVPVHGVTGVGHVGATHTAVATTEVVEMESRYTQVLGDAQFWQTGGPHVGWFTALASHLIQAVGPAWELVAGV